MDLPTRRQAALFAAKAWVFRLRRAFADLQPAAPRQLSRTPIDLTHPVRAEVRAALYSSDLAAEFKLQAGKVQNLRIAASHLDGLVVRGGEVFSFWRNLPRPTRAAGFAAGRELREGCIIPSVGGGLCQLSNLLYEAALQAGCEIVERHAHTRRLPGSRAAAGQDATVFWNYVDLRFRSTQPWQLEVVLSRDELVVRLRGSAETAAAIQPDELPLAAAPESCETCENTDCFRHPAHGETHAERMTAWLVDAWQPESDAYACEHRRPGDWLFVPLNGERWRIASYRWATAGAPRVRQAPMETLWRSWGSRRLASQGAARQRALLGFDEALAARYARGLPPEATHLVVSQNLLPFLWRDGALGGRTFDVLMTRLPLAQLQATLDQAAALHPESGTLADFRADPGLLEAESAALEEALHWITPHSQIAKLAKPRAVKIPWHAPPAAKWLSGGNEILFPASTLGRKGAYEMREAARRLGLRVRLGGPALERADFWNGIKVSHGNNLDGIAAVALPAWVENQPRRLLAAAAAGVPVIASKACGLEGVAGVITVPTGNVDALAAAIAQEAVC